MGFGLACDFGFSFFGGFFDSEEEEEGPVSGWGVRLVCNVQIESNRDKLLADIPEWCPTMSQTREISRYLDCAASQGQTAAQQRN